MGSIDEESFQDEQQQSRDLLLQAQMLGRTGYVISDARTGRVYWSDSLFELRKVPRRPYFAPGESLNFFHPEDRLKFIELRDIAIAKRGPFTMEWRFRRGDGSEIWERGIAQPQYDENGVYVSLLTVTQDITEAKRSAIALNDREAIYRTLFNGMGDAIILNNNGAFEDCNRAALEMFRCTREQLIGKTPDFISPERQPDGRDSAKLAGEKMAGVLRGERQFFEWQHKRFDGTVFDADVTINRVDIPGHNYFFGIIRDITARKSADEALRAAHEKFAGAFESSSDAMFVGTLGAEFGGGKVVDANLAAQTVLGYSRAELIGASISDLGFVPEGDALQRIRAEVIARQTIHALPVKFLRRDGALRDMEVSGSGFQANGVQHYLMIARDVTERNATERKIHDLNASLAATVRQLRDITDNLPIVITYQDPEGRLQFVNRMMERWFAKSSDEMIGKTVAEIATAEYLERVKVVREDIARGDSRSEVKVRFPDGIERIAEGVRFPDMDGEGVLRGFYTVMTDITERRVTEDHLRQSQKLQAIGKLTGGVAHDFNNLLAVILGNLELANEKLAGRDDSVRKLLAPALRAAGRGATLTRSLLAFARRQPLEPAVLNVGGLVRDMTNLLQRTVPADIEIELVGGAGLWKCEADAGELQNALLNLVVNARDAMPGGGKLTIETGNVRLDDEYARNNEEVTPGQYVMLAVSDTGTGMAPDVLARVFEPFFTTKAVGHGTGLGLSMVYGFAKQSKGHVAIYSEAGHGTAVRVYLPRWAGSADSAPARAPVQAHAANNETVLVVEDDEDVRFISLTMLRALGYNALEAPGGKPALDILASSDAIDLVLTDVLLAGTMNGRQVADQAMKLRPGIKILFMSGYTENAILHHGRLDPGLHFLQKPFRKHDLALKVRQALEGGEPPA